MFCLLCKNLNLVAVARNILFHLENRSGSGRARVSHSLCSHVRSVILSSRRSSSTFQPIIWIVHWIKSSCSFGCLVRYVFSLKRSLRRTWLIFSYFQRVFQLIWIEGPCNYFFYLEIYVLVRSEGPCNYFIYLEIYVPI